MFTKTVAHAVRTDADTNSDSQNSSYGRTELQTSHTRPPPSTPDHFGLRCSGFTRGARSSSPASAFIA